MLISNKFQNADINTGSILEYIYYCWFIMWQKLNILQNDVIKLECVVEYYNTVDSPIVVIKVIHNADINTGSGLK